MSEQPPTVDDTRRALEATGLRSSDWYDLTRAALDAYSEVFTPSRKEQRHHEQGLLAAIAATAHFLTAAELERQANEIWQEHGAGNETDEDYVTGVDDAVVRMRARAAELRGESR
ncbi:hypothetical protein [Kutzneria albida]|uniref:Uncharacterized protein n=1 Tax=Kutzneria albida DSM 43870 TaxID=1449976 RepID=W5WAU2_9PSEU|nr:hypothetical protein [Kutzneria albida]AHH98248.1 hypothetical protein KALB_4886 [Kutzneria albida DSM 43870]